jgi:hypothetical protein
MHFYVAEETAFAPGIAGEWPEVVAKPDNSNGRLVKVEGVEALLNEVRAEAIASGNTGREIQITKVLGYSHKTTVPPLLEHSDSILKALKSSVEKHRE